MSRDPVHHRSFSKVALAMSVASIICLLGCTKSGGGSGSGGGGTLSTSSSGGSAGETTTACGVVTNGALQNPAVLADGQKVRITQVLSNNLVTVTSTEGGTPLLVKIQGVANAENTANNQSSMSLIRQIASGNLTFFKATRDCQAAVSGGTGTIGSIITSSGTSLSEELIKSGFSPADENDACRGDLLGSCLAALGHVEGATSSGVGCGFLWKPVSDSDGKLAVLVDECDVRVIVNGEELRQAGAGNGRCTTARGSKPGCAYGQANVEIYDLFTGLPYVFKDGKTKLSLNGCVRYEQPCT